MRPLDKNRITQSVVIGLTTLLAAIALTGLKSLLFQDSGNWIGPVVSFFFWLVFLSLTLLLSNSKPLLVIAMATMLISFILIFGLAIENLAAVSIATILFAFGAFEAVNEKKVRIKFRVRHILHGGLPHVLTGLALLIAIAYYASPYALKGVGEVIIPRTLFDHLMTPLIGTLEDELSTAMTPMPALPGLPSHMFAGGAVTEELTDQIYGTLNEAVNRYSFMYRKYLSVGLAVSVFFALKTIGILFMWLVIPIAWLIFKLLMHFGAIKIQEQSVLQEIIHV